ncbi:MAG: Hpt domain-containing protein [Pikeienuella sp.]
MSIAGRSVATPNAWPGPAGEEPSDRAIGVAQPVALDEVLLGEMVDLYGAETVAAFLDSLRSEAAEDLDALGAAAAGGDLASAGRALHALRGAALNLGCTDFAARALALETDAAGGRLPSRREIGVLAETLELSLAAIELSLPPERS